MSRLQGRMRPGGRVLWYISAACEIGSPRTPRSQENCRLLCHGSNPPVVPELIQDSSRSPILSRPSVPSLSRDEGGTRFFLGVFLCNPSMEVEVKIRLADAAAHQKVAALLAASHQVTYLQENVFFDGAAQQLSSARMVLRLRFYNGDERCVVTLKGKAVIIDGISRGSEVEEDIDVALARSGVADASQLVVSDCKLLQQIIREYECESFVCLGGFRNVRNVYDWEGVKLELDETHYAFGTTYEIECETTDPERFRQLLGELLDKNGISYRYSTISKFGIFRAGKIGALD